MSGPSEAELDGILIVWQGSRAIGWAWTDEPCIETGCGIVRLWHCEHRGRPCGFAAAASAAEHLIQQKERELTR